MPDFIAEGFVSIVPDFTQFDALLQSKITAALAQVQAAQAGSAAASVGTSAAAPSLAAAAPGFAAIQSQATAAANAVTGQLTPALNSVVPVMKNVKTASDDAGTSLKGLQSQFTSLSRLAPLLVAGLSIKAFADFQRAAETAGTVFGESAQGILDFAKNLGTQFGFTQAQIIQAVTLMGQSFTQFGFSADVAAGAAEQLVQRAGDVAAAFGVPNQQILKAFQLAVEGNTRGLKQLGIDISAVDLQNQALKDGFQGTVSSLADGQKALLIQQLILQDTAKFAGEAARQSGSLSEEFRTLKAEAGDAAKSLGEALAPSVGVLVTLFGDLLKGIGAIPGPIKEVGAVAAIAAVSIKALSAAFGFIETSIVVPVMTAISTSIATAGATAQLAAGEFLAAGAGLEGIGAAALIAAPELATILGPVGIIAAGVFVFKNLADGADKAKTSIENLVKAGSTEDLKQKFIGAVEASTSLSDQLKIQLGNSDTIIGVFIQNARKKIAELFAVDPNAARDLANSFNPEGPVGKSLREKIQELVKGSQDLTDRQKAEALAFDGAGKSAKEASTELQALFTTTDQLTKATDALHDSQDRVKDIQSQINVLQKEGGKQELIEAQDKLTNATDAHTQALARQKAAQEALDELQAPATQRELTDATDAVTLAQLGLNDALRAQKAAQDALNRTHEIHLDLTGKDLAQIRDAIDNARASQQADSTVSKGKTQAELQDDLSRANIGVTSATEKVDDAQKTLNDTVNKGNTALLQSKDAIDKVTAAQYAKAQADNAVISTLDTQNKAQFELNQKLAGQTNYATQLAALQKQLGTAKDAEAKAQAQITADTAKQKDDLNTIFGVTNQISAVLKQNIKDNPALFQGNIGLQTQVLKDVITQLGGSLDTAANFQLGGLGPANIQKLFNAIQSDPSTFKQLLKSFGVNIPGFAEGSIIERPTLAHVGENSLAELILPLTKPDRAWNLLAESLPKMSLPLRQKLEPIIMPDVKNLGHVQTPQVLISSGISSEQAQQIIDLLDGIHEKTSGDVDVNVYPTAGMNERQLTAKIEEVFKRILGGR